jgi:hypothetical protein
VKVRDSYKQKETGAITEYQSSSERIKSQKNQYHCAPIGESVRRKIRIADGNRKSQELKEVTKGFLKIYSMIEEMKIPITLLEGNDKEI